MAEKLAKEVAKTGESGIIKSKRNSFLSQDDPMYEVTGSAYDSHPSEISEITSQLNEWGVVINFTTNSLNYGCTRIGVPGTMSVSKDASYSAWLHEFQHVKDDYEAGWDGLFVLWNDCEDRIRRERRAYGVEIELAKSIGREDIVKRLEANLYAEIKRIERDFSKYSDYL